MVQLGKVKRMENAFLNLLSKKDNIYLCRSTDNWIPYPWVTTGLRLLSLVKHTLKEMVPNQRESTFHNKFNLNGNIFRTSVSQPNPS